MFRICRSRIFTVIVSLALFTGMIVGKGLYMTQGDPMASAEVLMNDGDCVFLLHGISRSSFLMNGIADRFYEAGYTTININYPSTAYDLDTLTEMTLESYVPEFCTDKTVNFVGHSMGGIITRNYLANNDVSNLGKVVMIASPNKGSEVADFLNKYFVTRIFFGPALGEIGTSLDLPEPDYEVGIIAATQSMNPILSRILPGPDDSRVSVESTKLDSMVDYMEIEATHSFVTFLPDVQEAALRFIQLGEF